MPPQKFNVGLVQMSATPDPDKNLQHAIDEVHEAAAQGRRLSACRNFFRRNISVSAKTPTLFDLAEPIPGPTTAKSSRDWLRSYELF